MLNGNRIRALRHAREIVSDLRWRGMTVPPIYTSMAEEFQALVRSGAYAAWVASSEKARREPKANPTATPLAHALAVIRASPPATARRT
jgi:hypothetical protein